MKLGLKRILWAGLIISLLLSFQGIAIRMSNESNNKVVLTVVDYKDFYKAANTAGMDVDKILEDFRDNGTKTVAVRETTLADLNYSGDALVIPAGEYLSKLQGESSTESRELYDLLAEKDFNPSSYFVITSSQNTAAYLEERLVNRIESVKLDKLTLAEKVVFNIGPVPDKNLEIGIGFDEAVLKKLHNLGFELVLRPQNSQSPSSSQMSEYRDLISGYNIKYIIFEGMEIAGYPMHFDSIWKIVEENGIITGIIEAPSQVRFVEQKGLEELIKATGYAINRVYITPQKDLEKLTGSDIFHRWIRCVVDRNIRFIYIQPLKNPAMSVGDNIHRTLEGVGRLNSFLVSKDYTIDMPLKKLSTSKPSGLHTAVVLLSELLALLLYLIYLFGYRKRYILISVLLVLAAGVAAVTVLGFNLQQFLAAFAAILYPSFASLLVLKYLKENRGAPLLKQIPELLRILLGVSLLGGYTVVTILSDIAYIMNVEIYKGVLLSFSVPLLLFIVNYFACFVSMKGIIGRIADLMSKKISYLSALAAFLGVAVIILYLARSGNDSGISASALEIKIRNLLEGTMAARPRFKEFLIGYPALFAAAYLYKRFRKEIILLPLGIAVVMGSVSIVNSFCHVFTAVEVAALRTANGLGFGIIAGLAVTAAIKVCLWVYDKFLGKHLSLTKKS